MYNVLQNKNMNVYVIVFFNEAFFLLKKKSISDHIYAVTRA